MQYAQLTLDGMDAPSAKIIALHKVESHADPAWMLAAFTTVELIAYVHDTFTTDAVWKSLEQNNVNSPREPRAMGAVMRKAAQDGLIEATGRYQQSTRDSNHQRPVAIWCSLVR